MSMRWEPIQFYIDFVLQLLTDLVVFGLSLLVILVVALYIQDITQTKHAVRRNYPVVGRFRYLFERMGEFFRQYFFAMDREEMPFNRAQRAWVYRSAKDVDSTVPFGSTRNLSAPGQVIFVNTPFPKISGDPVPTRPMRIGPHCRQPYDAPSLFNVSAMSYGAISKPAVLALSKGAKLAGCWLNTGEGGLSPWHLEGGCDLVFQIGTARYGVRDADGNLCDQRLTEVAALPQVKMFELKLSQGAKPGKGGLLPGAKVSDEVSAIRGIPKGRDSVSPSRHPDIASVQDLLAVCQHIREKTGKPVGFKLALGSPAFMEELCGEIQRQGQELAPDFITLDSADGGTGAAPQSLIDYLGMPLRESLPLVADRLAEAGLTERIRLIASGKLIEPGAVAWALCAGADFVNSARGFMFALGCIQAMQCNKNSCPTGITTHRKRLQKGLVVADKAQRVARYCRNMHHEIGVIAHSCGVAEPRLLDRSHARMMTADGKSVPLDELYPPPRQGAARGPA